MNEDVEYCITYLLNSSLQQGLCSTKKDMLEETAGRLTQTYQKKYWVSRRGLWR